MTTGDLQRSDRSNKLPRTFPTISFQRFFFLQLLCTVLQFVFSTANNETHGLTRVAFSRSSRLEFLRRQVSQQISTNRKHNVESSLYRCVPGKTGADCSERKCPYSLGAPTNLDFDYLYSPWHIREDSVTTNSESLTDTAVDAWGFSKKMHSTASSNRHVYLECGARGNCNRKTGECNCFAGFSGQGCRRMECPNHCSGHGQCLTDAASLYHHGYYTPEKVPRVTMDNDICLPAEYRHTGLFASDNFWQAEMVTTCICDPGYSGPDCSLRSCPTGDDPLTECQEDLGYDVQEIQCHALPIISQGMQNTSTPTNSTVWFSLQFEASSGLRFETHPIAIDINVKTAAQNAAAMQVALEQLPNFVIPTVQVDATIQDDVISYAVSFTDAETSGLQKLLDVKTDKPCGFGTSYFENTDAHFDCDVLRRYDTEGRLTVDFSTTSSSNSTDENIGINMRENVECSNRGSCDRITGLCDCFPGFTGAACADATKFAYF